MDGGLVAVFGCVEDEAGGVKLLNIRTAFAGPSVVPVGIERQPRVHAERSRHDALEQQPAEHLLRIDLEPFPIHTTQVEEWLPNGELGTLLERLAIEVEEFGRGREDGGGVVGWGEGDAGGDKAGHKFLEEPAGEAGQVLRASN